MDSLLDALQEGRLIELPENTKEDALRFLAHILEAIPSLPAGLDVVGAVMERERSAETALGGGWACPHARVPFEEDLICVVGWSPPGIDYGAPDGKPVHILTMYLVPQNQRNHFLREVSLLAKALRLYPGLDRLAAARELNEVRDHLLELIVTAREKVGPESRARMIQLQARVGGALEPLEDLSRLKIEPVTVIAGPGMKPVVLTQNAELASALEAAGGWVEKIESDGVVQNGGWRLLRRGTTVYANERTVYDCLAIASAGKKANSAR